MKQRVKLVFDGKERYYSKTRDYYEIFNLSGITVVIPANKTISDRIFRLNLKRDIPDMVTMAGRD